MLAGMSSTEYADWRNFYQDNYFQDALLDIHFSSVLYMIASLFNRDPQLTPATFSLLSRDTDTSDDEAPDDTMLMAKAAGLSGGMRYGPDGSG
nr:phage tail assembly protein T [[Enterobacter] lignolyticus]